MSAVGFVLVAAVVGLVAGSALIPGAPVFGLPIAAILVAVLGLTEFRRRRADRHSLEGLRDRAGEGEGVDFTARDRRTLGDSAD